MKGRINSRLPHLGPEPVVETQPVAQSRVPDRSGELLAHLERRALRTRLALWRCVQLGVEQHDGEFRPVPVPVELRVLGGLRGDRLGHQTSDREPGLGLRIGRQHHLAVAAGVQVGLEQGARVRDASAQLEGVPPGRPPGCGPDQPPEHVLQGLAAGAGGRDQVRPAVVREPKRGHAGCERDREARPLALPHRATARGVGLEHVLPWRRDVDGGAAATALPHPICRVRARDGDAHFVPSRPDHHPHAVPGGGQHDHVGRDGAPHRPLQGGRRHAAQAHRDDVRAVVDRVADRLGHGNLRCQHDAGDGPDRHMARGRGRTGHPEALGRDDDARGSGAVAGVLAVERIGGVRVAAEDIEPADPGHARQLGVLDHPRVRLRDHHAEPARRAALRLREGPRFGDAEAVQRPPVRQPTLGIDPAARWEPECLLHRGALGRRIHFREERRRQVGLGGAQAELGGQRVPGRERPRGRDTVQGPGPDPEDQHAVVRRRDRRNLGLELGERLAHGHLDVVRQLSRPELERVPGWRETVTGVEHSDRGSGRGHHGISNRNEPRCNLSRGRYPPERMRCTSPRHRGSLRY